MEEEFDSRNLNVRVNLISSIDFMFNRNNINSLESVFKHFQVLMKINLETG